MKKNIQKISRLGFAFIIIFVLIMGVVGSANEVEAADSPFAMKAMWISYIDISSGGLKDATQAQFRANFTTMCNTAISNACNTVIVQVRPNSDAIYPSDYYPWSTSINSNGQSPGYNPLAIMVEIAHSKGLKIQAWINPYRISSNSTTTAALNTTKNYNKGTIQQKYNEWNQAGMVIAYASGSTQCLGLNPDSAAARQLIINGVAELVNNYQIDGIVFDDYFYVGTSKNLVPSAADRRNVVNVLIRDVHSAINGRVPFGVSPSGNIDSARDDGADIDTWLANAGYIDYIAPQLYWSNSYLQNNSYVTMFSNRLQPWITANKRNIPIYPALAVYKTVDIGQNGNDKGWESSKTNLASQWMLASSLGCDGYSLYRIAYCSSPTAAEELANLRNTSGPKLLDTTNKYVAYESQVQDVGWQNSTSDGGVSGTTGIAKRIEAIMIKLGDKVSSGGITYRTYVQENGWLAWESDGTMSGTVGQGKRIEALQIQLTGDAANQYDVYYRTYVENIGWMGWAKNGGMSGTVDNALRIEAMQVQLVPKGQSAPGSTENSYLVPNLYYTTHVQDFGWQDYVINGKSSGTSGQSKRLEGIKINLANQEYTGDIQYTTHVQDYGWQDWSSNGDLSGTSGKSKRLEAIRIRLTGEMANHYDIYYRVHAQDYGWLDWAKNGADSGTTGMGKRLEAIQIVLVAKGGAAPGATATPCVVSKIGYSTQVQDIGWQDYSFNGELAGTSGQGKRLEAIKINLCNQEYLGNIRYQVHVQDIGWQDWATNGSMSGTAGQSKRLEGIKIELTDDMKAHYDIYYRVHVQDYGWQDWVSNGAMAGTSGQSKRLEGIQIKLVAK